MKFVEFADSDGPAYVNPVLVTDVFAFNQGSKIRMETLLACPELTTLPREIVRVIEEWYGHSVFVEFADQDGPVFMRPEYINGVFTLPGRGTVICSKNQTQNIRVNQPIQEVIQILEAFWSANSCLVTSSDLQPN